MQHIVSFLESDHLDDTKEHVCILPDNVQYICGFSIRFPRQSICKQTETNNSTKSIGLHHYKTVYLVYALIEDDRTGTRSDQTLTKQILFHKGPVLYHADTIYFFFNDKTVGWKRVDAKKRHVLILRFVNDQEQDLHIEKIQVSCEIMVVTKDGMWKNPIVQ